MNKRKGTITMTCILVALQTFLISPDCISQNTSSTQNILVLQKTTLKSGQTKPDQKIFKQNCSISVRRYSNPKVLRGKIDSINNSSIYLKGNLVDIKDIKRINTFRGKALTFIGPTLILTSISLSQFAFTPPNEYGNSYITLAFFPVFFGFVGGMIVTCTGLIEILTTKHYHLDKDYKIVIK